MKKDTAIVYIITKLELGGAQKVCLSLFNNIGFNNIESEFSSHLISGKEGFFLDQVKENPNAYLFDNLKREVSLLNIFNEIKSFFKLIVKLREIKKDYKNIIVHTHSTKAGILGRWAALFAGVKNRVHTVHGFAFHDNQNKIKWAIIYFIELITSIITTHFVCVSVKDAQTGSKLFPKFKQKHSIIRAAIDYEKFYEPNYIPATFPKDDQQFTFGTISCFKQQKNLIDLLEAFKLVNDRNHFTALEIIGDGHQRQFIENWIAKNKLEKNIVLHGWQTDVSKYLKSWHTFVLSSLWEGLPCSIIEARMYKLPILSYDTGGITEVIFNNQNGLIYNQKDYQSLAKGMLEISKDSNIYLKLQQYNDDLSAFKDSYMIEQHANLYKFITANP